MTCENSLAQPKYSSFALVNYLLLLGVGLIWGSQFLLNKIALEGFSASLIAAGRVAIGTATLAIILAVGFKKSGQAKPQRPFWHFFPDFILIGLLEATIPLVLVAWAQERLASSVTAILIGTVPLFATLLEALFIKGSDISAKKVVGVTLGFFGIVVLVGHELFAARTAAVADSSSILPALAVLASALSFAAAMLLIRMRLSHMGSIHAAQGILLGAAITTVPLALWLANPWAMTAFHPSLHALMALGLLGIFCGGLVYTLFVVLINRAGPSFASMSNYLVPLVGAFIGIAFSGEKLTLALICSLTLILFSLWLSSGKPKAEAGS
jgi:drug/metabolite transporter (DMT)-like permease